MAVNPHDVVNPFTLKTASVLFKLEGATDSDDFSKPISDITFTPTAQSGSWTGCSGNTISEQGIATWVAGFGLVQDLDDDSLLLWLLEHEGEKAEVTATLKTGATAFVFTVTLTPATIGGAIGPNPLSSTVNLPMDGKPVPTAVGTTTTTTTA